MEGWMNGQTDRQMDKWTDRQNIDMTGNTRLWIREQTIYLLTWIAS